MPLPFEIVAPVKDGRIPDPIARLIGQKIAEFDGGVVKLYAGPVTRSTRANAYYWSCVIAPIQYAWHLAGKDYGGQALHGYFKDTYLAVIAQELLFDHGIEVDYIVEEARPDGKVETYLTTTRLCPTSFYRFVEAVKGDEAVQALFKAYKLKFEPPPKGLRSGRIHEWGEAA